MTNERKLVALIVALSLALPAVSYYSFRTGYKLWPEVHGRYTIQIPSK